MKPKVKNWIGQLRSGNIKSNTTKLLLAIHTHTYKGRGYTHIHELRKELQMSHQSLTAILSNVMDEGMVEDYGEIKVDDTFYSKLSYTRPENRDMKVELRRNKKYEDWLKRGIQEFDDKLPPEVIDILKNL